MQTKLANISDLESNQSIQSMPVASYGQLGDNYTDRADEMGFI